MLHSNDSYCLTAQPPENATALTDEQLMEQIKQGDEKALESLRGRHIGLMRTIINRATNDDSETDDIVQECLVQIWQRAENYCAQRGPAIAWIVTMVRRRSIDRIRRRTAYMQAQERLREESTAVCQGHVVGSDEQVAQNDRAQAVARLIERLPEPQQEVVRLTFYQGMSQRQIAAHTGLPLGTIKTRMELAMRKLRSAARAFGEFRGEIEMGRVNVIAFHQPRVSWPEAA